MTRDQGRRAARRPERQPARPGQALAALATAVLTVVALLAAGSAGRSTGPQPTAQSHLDLGTRSFVCTGGLAHTSAIAGSTVAGGRVTAEGRAQRNATLRLSRPVRVLADRTAAPGAHAVQVARDPRWLATGACPEPRPTWWFVGAGASDRHHTVLTVANPRPGSAIFDVDVLGPDGPVDAPGLHGLTLASGATRTLDLARLAPASGDLAVRVRTSRGLVAASAAESWAPALIGRKAREWVAPQPAQSRHLDLTGLSPASSSTLLVANPGSREAVARLRIVGKGGTFTPTGHASVTVAPGTLRSVDVTDVVRPGTATVRLDASRPVVAGLRSVKGLDESYATATPVLHGTGTVGVPPGVRAGLVLSSVAAPDSGTAARSRARVVAYSRHDGRLLARNVAVPAGGSVTVALPARARAVSVSAATEGSGGTGPVGAVVGAVVVRAGAGIGSLPLVPSVTAQRRPGVLPGW